MRRFLHLIFKFFFALIFVNQLYGYILINTDWNIKSSVNFFHHNKENIDILVLGNSLGMDGIDAQLITEKTGLNCYNACIEGGSIFDSLNRLKYALNKNNIRTVIVASNFDYISNCGNEHIVTSGFSQGYYLCQNFLSRYQSFHIGILKKIVSVKHRKSRIIKGQLQYENLYIDSTSLKYTNKEFDFSSFECYTSMIDLANSNQINMIFINMPLFKENRHLLSDQKFYSNNVLNLNGPFIEDIINSNKHFGSRDHLNKHGARTLTLELLKLTNNFTLGYMNDFGVFDLY